MVLWGPAPMWQMIRQLWSSNPHGSLFWLLLSLVVRQREEAAPSTSHLMPVWVW